MKYTLGQFVHKSGYPNTDAFWPRYRVYGMPTAGTTVTDYSRKYSMAEVLDK